MAETRIEGAVKNADRIWASTLQNRTYFWRDYSTSGGGLWGPVKSALAR